MTRTDLERISNDIHAMAWEHGAASDDHLWAIVQWMGKHPEAPPDAIAYLGRFLINLWHADFGPEWMGRELWLRAFRGVGFVSDSGKHLPRRSLVVFRGATTEDRFGMAWSTNRAVAVGHALAEERVGNEPYRRIDPSRKVWRAIIPPAGIMARIAARGEAEVVVDPELLKAVTAVAVTMDGAL